METTKQLQSMNMRTGKTKALAKSAKSILLLLAMLVMGQAEAWADTKSLPYSYDFSTPLDEEGWTRENCNSYSIINSGAFRFYYNTNPPQYLISPELEAISSTVDVSFQYKVQSSTYVESFQVGYSKTDNNTASFTWDTQVDPTNTTYTEYKTTFPAGVKYVAIRYNANDKYYLFIDDFKVCKTPTCFVPTGLTTSELTSSSVTLNWTSDADAWNMQYKKAADSEWTDVSGNLSSKSYTLSGLLPATAYQARVRTYCDATDQSEWTDAVSFTTDCATLTIDANNSFSEDFSDAGLPACWTINNENKTGGSGWSIADGQGYSGYYGDTYLVMPPMTLGANMLLIFDNKFDYTNYYNKSSVVISTTGTAAADFSTTLYTFEKSELPSSSTVLQKEVSLAAYSGQTVYIAFKYEGSNAHAWYIDNIVVEQAPACPKPTGLTASNETYQGATLSWTAGSDETEWKVIYGATGFDPASEGTTIDNVTTNSYTLTGLTPETSYDVYVKAVKGSDVSPVSDKASFTTLERYPAPTALTATGITTTSATISWTGNGDETKWEITWNTTGTTPEEEGSYTEVSTTSYEITGLETETTYYAFVRSKDASNHSDWSAKCEFTPSANTYMTVNDGTTTNYYVPINGYFSAAANLGGQFIIPTSNLTDVQNKVIKKLTFYSATTDYAFGDAEFDVFVKEVGSATMTKSMYDWDESWTKVYSGTLAIVGGKMSITFTSDYNYNGSNLLVGIHKTSTDKSASTWVLFYGTNAGSGNYRSNYNPNGERQTFQPKTTIGYQAKTTPELVVTDSESAEQTSGLNYNFGECDANANVTYSFTNVGAGTINITNVAITGDGAAAYSTNWTENTACPYNLTITRTYNGERVGASAAVITVTTSEGEFVINVTGTDKSSNAPELAVSTNAINFGNVSANAVQTVTVTNNGTGSMTVNIVSNNADFEVSPASLTGIGVGGSKTFTVTFKYGTPYGVKNGNITVTPTYNAEAAETITVTGKAKDPTTWSEDFEGNALPTGWEAGSNWSFADGVAKGAYVYGSTTYLTTPKLEVSATTDELTFDYKATSNYVSVEIQMSKDGGAFADYKTISGLNNGNTGSYTITDLEAGIYQFRFANDNYQLDNFDGFKLKAAAAHEAEVKAQTIPATGNQYVEYTASVDVKVTGTNDEELTVKFFIGDTQYGNSVVKTVTANATETFEVTFTPDAAVSGDAYFTIESTDIAAFESDKVAVSIAAATVLDEEVAPSLNAETIASLVVKYTAKSGWNTICMPFELTSDILTSIFGAGWKAYEFKSYENGELGFESTTSFSAGYPYIVYVETAATHAEGVKLQNISISRTEAQYDLKGGAYFRGTYAPIAAGGWTKNADTDNIYGVTSEGKIAKAGASATMKGFRAYFDLPAGPTAPGLSVQDQTTGITTIVSEGSQQNGQVYNLNGQKVNAPSKGLYIINGRKVVVK